jgi:hypothetical protein
VPGTPGLQIFFQLIDFSNEKSVTETTKAGEKGNEDVIIFDQWAYMATVLDGTGRL